MPRHDHGSQSSTPGRDYGLLCWTRRGTAEQQRRLGRTPAREGRTSPAPKPRPAGRRPDHLSVRPAPPRVPPPGPAVHQKQHLGVTATHFAETVSRSSRTAPAASQSQDQEDGTQVLRQRSRTRLRADGWLGADPGPEPGHRRARRRREEVTNRRSAHHLSCSANPIHPVSLNPAFSATCAEAVFVARCR